MDASVTGRPKTLIGNYGTEVTMDKKKLEAFKKRLETRQQEP
jgi:hypothetical protein